MILPITMFLSLSKFIDPDIEDNDVSIGEPITNVVNNNNILSLQDLYEFKVENKHLIRLHEHGLLRLITLNSEPRFSKVTNKIFFHSLLNNQVYQPNNENDLQKLSHVTLRH